MRNRVFDIVVRQVKIAADAERDLIADQPVELDNCFSNTIPVVE